MLPILIEPLTLERRINGDGQRFTSLIRAWANVYLRLRGAKDFWINDVSWRPDGGVDGLITDEDFKGDPFGWLANKTVMQFKAGSTSVSEASAELLKDPKEGQIRIKDKVCEGYKVVWFIGKALSPVVHESFEGELREVVAKINPDAPQPVVIDLNRLAELVSLAPSIAMDFAGHPVPFESPSKALSQTPHSSLPVFVPGETFAEFCEEVVSFFLDSTHSERLKYVAGEPGIGKTRTILECVQSHHELKDLVLYFQDPSKVQEFFVLARQHGLCACLIVDEFIGDSAATTRIDNANIPDGCRVLVIGHSYRADLQGPRVTDKLRPLTDKELLNALSANYKDLPEFHIREAVRMSKNNIRLARFFCSFFRNNPHSPGLDASSLGKIVSEELARMPSGQDVLQRLALVPYLLSADFSEFCRLTEINERDFREACMTINRKSALIQFNDHVTYIGSPAVAQYALIALWVDQPDLAKEVLNNPGRFSERVLKALNRLPSCPEKDAMLAFFALQTSLLKLEDLQDAEIAPRFLALLTADPGVHLPVLHRLIIEASGRLTEFRYEGSTVGRREIIWRIRDLAQFEEYFELAEQIMYALAKEEVPSASSNVATTYWSEWFRAWADNTAYPYQKRLDLLEDRALSGDDSDRMLVIRALASPFPSGFLLVPASHVGGRVVPAKSNLVYADQRALAIERIPRIVCLLLESGSSEVIQQTAEMVLDGHFRWLEQGAWEQYAQMVECSQFPTGVRHRVIAVARQYAELDQGEGQQPDKELTYIRQQHRLLLERIDDSDPVVEFYALADHGGWGFVEPGTTAFKKLEALVNLCLADSRRLEQAIMILGDPRGYGGSQFGRILGSQIDDSHIHSILGKVRESGFSQFTFGALMAFAQSDAARMQVTIEFAAQCEISQYLVAHQIYQFIGGDQYYRSAVRMLSHSEVPSGLYLGFSLASKESISDAVWAFVEAVQVRALQADEDAAFVLATIAGEFARLGVEDARALDIGTQALELIHSDHSQNTRFAWSEIALWLSASRTNEIISLATSREQSEFSEATMALEEIVKVHSFAVLNGLAAKLKAPYEPPYLFNGGLTSIVRNAPLVEYESWIRQQEADVLITLAGHLPKPYLEEGQAVVPDHTRKFWEVCTPSLGEAYGEAMNNFRAHTFGTGVIAGYGEDLFKDRVAVGRRLINDPSPAIREWAEWFIQDSKHMLEEALKRQKVDEARNATEH